KIMLADAKLSSLDARVFDVVTRAVDQGLVVDNGRISDLAGKSLSNGQFPLKHAEFPFQIVSGQLGMVDVSTESKEAGMSLTGMVDPTNRSAHEQENTLAGTQYRRS